MDGRKKLGNEGEAIARKYLKSRKYKILRTNFLSPYGEIDIIAIKNNQLIFCEVKTRSKYSPLTIEQVNNKKQKKIIRSADFFYSLNNDLSEFESRFDIILIHFSPDYRSHSVEHIVDAYDSLL